MTFAVQFEKTKADQQLLLERYAKIDLFRLELEDVVHEHELKNHMDFNDDNTYKSLMNEVSYDLLS